VITPDQVELLLVGLLCLFFLTGGVLIGYLARPLGEMADPAHNPALDRAEAAAWLAARQPTTLRPQLADEDVPDFLLWDAERGHRG
jgi:hypothetical protein